MLNIFLRTHHFYLFIKLQFSLFLFNTVELSATDLNINMDQSFAGP
jgi:hypothetical protein